ncbi:hypothetical protein M433DRAFT_9090 [Acidomyces richmondensis BFW]|nr:hypothetical protein M433DRAFT_9090 [Acidomyces richmondensis BFW]
MSLSKAIKPALTNRSIVGPMEPSIQAYGRELLALEVRDNHKQSATLMTERTPNTGLEPDEEQAKRYDKGARH